ncbi:myb domain protein 3r-3 [Striga asiatica]|uniref:Myb domain protein 3r-3 n=1 Tax=Striga asiatica TaxID=4170 RepID=A0A5A7QBY3_STRAF|nr:myb domain protein 3r-3 [Striga asiatica]
MAAINQVHSITNPSITKPSQSGFFIIMARSSPPSLTTNAVPFLNLAKLSTKRCLIPSSKASPADAILPTGADDEDGVSLGTMKLPPDTDVTRFETLLFQWGNSLCQGANLPLPVPLKVDKIPGGARLGFITIGNGETEVLVYIDCVVFPGSENSGPMFRAIRNGPKKAQPPPGEPRIMRSLLDALRKCVEIARL